MNTPELSHLLRGPFTFLRQTDEEIRRLFPEAQRVLPRPQRIFTEVEAATPFYGFPILATPDLDTLAIALEDCLVAEEEKEVAILRRVAFDQKTFNAAWERYLALLARALENVTLSSYGRLFPSVFWLFHSRSVARLLKNTPKRIARLDTNIGRDHGDSLKYKVFHRYLDRVLQVSYDLANRLAGDTEELEEELFPPLLTAMRDNVLVFTEDHVSPDLAELASYFAGYLRVDGRDLRARLEALAQWHTVQLQVERDLREQAAFHTGSAPEGNGRDLLYRPGYLAYLATRPAYDPRTLPRPDQIPVWEGLLLKLKEFELLLGLRRQLVVLLRQGNDLVIRDRDLERTWIGQQRQKVSAMTRPLDFMAPWVVDPQVSRCGMIYDITDFTELISTHRRAAIEDQDRAFRTMFRFQRKVNRMAVALRLKLEKYLGDGAFYSAREARRMLIFAIQVQRAYRDALREGFPFNRGMRIGINFGQYRLIPIQGSQVGGERYEFFGHGVIELSRLVTGKATREIDELKNMLVNQGYPEATVDRFFAPLTRKNLDVVNKGEEARSFYSYINPNGTLVNEGIVATGQYLKRLHDDVTDQGPLWRLSEGDRQYVVAGFNEGGTEYLVGFRRLGIANLKGLDRIAVYEIIDAEDRRALRREELPTTDLHSATDHLAVRGVGD
jgi:class 3 adenylate cyclase